MSQVESSSPSIDPSLPLEFRPLVLTRGKAEWLWERMSQVPQIFDDVLPRTFEFFVQGLHSPTNHFYEFVIGTDTVGLAAATQVRVGLDANLHLVMFDKRLRGREAVIKSAIRDFAVRARLRRLTVSLPEDNKTAIKLTLRLGFQLEGVLRKAHLRDGIFRDYHIFGILREELLRSDSNGDGPREAG